MKTIPDRVFQSKGTSKENISEYLVEILKNPRDKYLTQDPIKYTDKVLREQPDIEYDTDKYLIADTKKLYPTAKSAFKKAQGVMNLKTEKIESSMDGSSKATHSLMAKEITNVLVADINEEAKQKAHLLDYMHMRVHESAEFMGKPTLVSLTRYLNEVNIWPKVQRVQVRRNTIEIQFSSVIKIDQIIQPFLSEMHAEKVETKK